MAKSLLRCKVVARFAETRSLKSAERTRGRYAQHKLNLFSILFQKDLSHPQPLRKRPLHTRQA